MAKPKRRRNQKVSAWFLPLTLTGGLLIAGGILLVKSWHEKKQGGAA